LWPVNDLPFLLPQLISHTLHSNNGNHGNKV